MQRSWITGELAFAGQVLDNFTEHCADHANATFDLLADALPAGIMISRPAATADSQSAGPAASLRALDGITSSLPASKLNPSVGSAGSAGSASSAGSATSYLSSVSGPLLKPGTDGSRPKRGLLSPSKSPSRKKQSLSASGPASRTAAGADSSIATDIPLPLQSSRPASPLRTLRAAAGPSRSAMPSPARSPSRQPLSELNTTHGVGPGVAKKMASERPTGVSRLMMPTAASAARVQNLNTESTDSPLARKNTLKRVVSNTSVSLKHKQTPKPSEVSTPAEGRANRVLRSASRLLGLSKDHASVPSLATDRSERTSPKKPFAPGSHTLHQPQSQSAQSAPAQAAPAPRAQSSQSAKPAHSKEPAVKLAKAHLPSAIPAPSSSAATASAVSTPIPRVIHSKVITAEALKSSGMPPPPSQFHKLNLAAPKPLDGLTYSKDKIQIVGMPPPAVSRVESPAPPALPDISDCDESSVLLEWANTPEVAKQLESQLSIDPMSVFGPMAPLKMSSIFNSRRLRPRTSSGVWARDGLSAEEQANYNERMGYKE